MKKNIEIWLERLSSLYKSQIRQAASAEGMQVVHAEILQYLSIANHYSNTAQAVSEYFGQTKGSISQSLKVLEKDGYVLRKPCTEDKRVTRLYLTEQGRNKLAKVTANAMPDIADSEENVSSLKSILEQWQSGNRHMSFGQCQTCRYHQKLTKGHLQCGLTGAPLSIDDSKKICREHKFI